MADKPRDLQERTAQFALRVRALVRSLPRTIANIEDAKQLVRSSGSVAANCIEANEALGDKDCLMRFRICRKEAKESHLWLRLIDVGAVALLAEEKTALSQEAQELKLILTAIIKKLE